MTGQGSLVTWLVLVLVVAGAILPEPAVAQSQGSEASGTVHEARGRNALGLRVGYAGFLNRPRDSAVAEEEAPGVDHLWGFIPTYVRTLIPERLNLTVSKPFFFSRDRFDSPFEVMLVALTRLGPVETFAGVGPVLNLRVFHGERENIEERGVEVSFGVTVALGISMALSPRWLLELEGAYAYAISDPVVEHEFNLTLGPAYVF